MKNEFKELMSITEHSHGVATTLISDVVSFEDFENGIKRREEERDEIVKSLFTLSRAQLSDEINEIRDYYLKRENGNSWNIEKSEKTEHDNIIINLSFLMNNEGEFGLLVYFGGKADSNTSIIDGLLHAIEIVSAIEAEY